MINQPTNTTKHEFLLKYIMNMINNKFDDIIFLMILKRLFLKIHPTYDRSKIYISTLYTITEDQLREKVKIEDMMMMNYYCNSSLNKFH